MTTAIYLKSEIRVMYTDSKDQYDKVEEARHVWSTGQYVGSHEDKRMLGPDTFFVARIILYDKIDVLRAQPNYIEVLLVSGDQPTRLMYSGGYLIYQWPEEDEMEARE